MNVTFEMKERNMIVKIDGEIDHHTSEYIRDKIDKAYSRNKAKNIIFDFSGIHFMDSSGIGVIMGRFKNITHQGGEVVIVNLQPQIDRVFQLSGLYKIIKKYDDIDDAIKMLQ